MPQLAPETLHQVIQHCGLEACAEIVTSATPAQLVSVLDLDLWRNARPGHDERFDVDRFGEWLEVLTDAGSSVAARTVAAVDENVVIAGLSRHVRVFDSAAIKPLASDDDPTDIDAPAQEGLECEVGGYLVRAAGANAWDAIVALLLALDSEHHDRFHALMRGVRRLSNSTPEIDGLDDLLLEPEQLLHDLAHDRDHRRSQQGYSTPAAARAFLQMARQWRPASPYGPGVNPIVAAYFRSANVEAAPREGDARTARRFALDSPSEPADVREALDAFANTFAAPGVGPQQPRALLGGTAPHLSHRARIRSLMESVREHDATTYLTRGSELAFLANTLVAGCSIQSRSFTPQEASEAAISVCQLGLEHWPARWPTARAPRATSMTDVDGTLPETFLIDHDLVTAFEVGWAVLHEDVCVFVADQLVVALSDLQCGDPETQEGLDAFRIELTRQREAGTPWRALEALDVIATLDTVAWASLLGVLAECPVMPAALTAAIEGRTGAVRATDFEFISTRSQLGAIRDFMDRLPDMLRPDKGRRPTTPRAAKIRASRSASGSTKWS